MPDAPVAGSAYGPFGSFRALFHRTSPGAAMIEAAA